MSNATKINFKTPGGLKIRLNYKYFFYQLTKTDRYYNDTEIINSDTMYNAAANIETMYLIPTMLIQVFSLIALIFHISVSSFCVGMALLYVFGCVWRCLEQDLLLSTALMFLSTVYRMTWWLIYIVLIVLALLLNGTSLIISYLVIRIALFLFSLVENHILVRLTMKKYDMPFNDTEICAFRVFNILSKSNLKMSDYIWLYVETIKRAESEEAK